MHFDCWRQGVSWTMEISRWLSDRRSENHRNHAPNPDAAAPAGARDLVGADSAAPFAFGAESLLVGFRVSLRPPPANFHDASGVDTTSGVRLKVHDRL